jgi:hypothetical protein
VVCLSATLAVVAVLLSIASNVSGAQAASPEAGDGVMLVMLRRFSFAPDTEDVKDEATIVKCITDSLRARRPGQRMVSFEEFQRVAFPRLTPATAPKRPEFLELMFRDAAFRRRIETLNLRYVVYIGGVSEIGKKSGGGICYIGPVSGCVIVREWDRDTRIGATVMDIDRRQVVGKTEARAAGKSWFALVVIVPIGNVADTEGKACWDLGAKLATILERNRHRTPVPGAAPNFPSRKDKRQ